MSDPDDLNRLAEQLESLSDVRLQAAAEIAPQFREKIAAMGRNGGPLKSGNAAALTVSASGEEIQVHAIFPSDKSTLSWLKWIRKQAETRIAEAVSKRLSR